MRLSWLSMSLLLFPYAGFAQEMEEGLKAQDPSSIQAEEEISQEIVSEIVQVQGEHKSPEEIQAELDSAEAQFARAQKMFNPWYTGPIVTASPSMMPVGQGNMQPYLFIADNYAAFNEDRESIGLPSNLVQVKGQYVLQTGVSETTDFIIVPGGIASWQSGQFGGGFLDLSATYGFLVHSQTRYTPQVKFQITETFPTGKYQNLSFNGLMLNATGAGCYSTQFGLIFGKLFFWTTQHPFNTRLFFGYQVSTSVHVENFNAYGGGFKTRGTVHPGNNFQADLGLELSLTEKWVLATDIVYTATNRTTFSGHPGFTDIGEHTPASVGSGYNDNLSIAPAIEYNWSSSAGFIGGAWFSVYGRNSLNFAQAVLSITYGFPP